MRQKQGSTLAVWFATICLATYGSLAGNGPQAWRNGTDGSLAASNEDENIVDPKLIDGRSYIDRLASSWHVFAKANDISKREKLRKALADALRSIDGRKKDVILNQIKDDTAKRIKHAASLLKEFKRMYSISAEVNKASQDFDQAKSSLVNLTSDKLGQAILKRFLIQHDSQTSWKRNEIGKPSILDRQWIDRLINEVDVEDLASAITRRSNRPLFTSNSMKTFIEAGGDNGNGKPAVLFATTDVKQARIRTARRGINAVKLILKYMPHQNRTLPGYRPALLPITSDREKMVKERELRNSKVRYFKSEIVTQSGLTKIPSATGSDLLNRSIDAAHSYGSGEISREVASVMDSLLDTDVATRKNESSGNEEMGMTKLIRQPDRIISVSDRVAPGARKSEALHATDAVIERTIEKPVKSTPTSEVTGVKKDDGTNSTVNIEANIDELRNALLNILNRTNSEDMHGHGTDGSNPRVESRPNNGASVPFTTAYVANHTILKNTNPLLDSVHAQVTSVPGQNISKPLTDIHAQQRQLMVLTEAETIRRQQETIQRLKEAKAAHKRYEEAKHELAEKVKELYNLANQFEKEETNDQILEVKTFISGLKEQKRDNEHPGVALSQIHSHNSKAIQTDTDTNSADHRGFTMGALDERKTTTHEVALQEPALTAKVAKVYDLSLPVDVQPEDVGEIRKVVKAGGQEDTLKVLAEAIKQDMEEISKNEKKKKLLTSVTKSVLLESFPKKSALSLKQGNPVTVEVDEKSSKKKGDTEMSDVDDYLTKALAEIMADASNDSKASDSSSSGRDGKESKKQPKSIEEKNMKIVEEAMKAHAKNPNLALPLVNKQGEEMKLNKENANEEAREEASQHDKNEEAASNGKQQEKSSGKSLDELRTAETKALLDKASHLEEQVAAAQEKLYSSAINLTPELQTTKDIVSQSSSSKSTQALADPYGSIREGIENSEPIGDPRMTETADPEEEEDEDTEDDERHHDHHLHHHHGHHHSHDDDDEELDEDEEEPDEDEDDDDDSDEDYKKSRVHYRQENGRKRSHTRVETGPAATSIGNAGSFKEDLPNHEELEDTKKSTIPGSIYRLKLTTIRK